MTRRSFLRASAILTFAALPNFALSAAQPGNGRLLVLLLRGGVDGLFAMPPVGDPGLKGRRRNLMPNDLLKLDGFFALHPNLKTVHKLYDAGQALLVHGTSIPYTGRSHFDGQDVMESGASVPYSSPTGWLGRALDTSGYHALAMSLPIPLILRGKQRADSRYPSWIAKPPTEGYALLAPLWASDSDVAPYGEQILEPEDNKFRMMQPQPGQSPDLTELARQAGLRLREDDGPRVAVIDHVGFDTHASQPGQHSDKLRDVDRALQAFRQSIGEVWKDTLVVTITEFGRTVAENGSWGTDHGWATCVFVIGGALKKGGLVTDWPGLKPKELYEGRDLKATIDARSLYGAVLSASLGIDPGLVAKDVMEFPKDDRFDEYLL